VQLTAVGTGGNVGVNWAEVVAMYNTKVELIIWVLVVRERSACNIQPSIRPADRVGNIFNREIAQ
jgi:hypothetical protein